ncbi:uncharacterized protein MELLADRAFT_36660 [Melampsora larici-populina 98AG31]|uniref:Thioredoxin-like fold domain-containing protein n=1 Tax=Melampsora larici-populina (strain 98AG31 / pathotype 3-4-7) TaxID=747676 RepID=F4RQ02_MELLP|nr:uncharacterized protein MELLADRAFT_36660 [Melampsora larici-populina 98AG31]EGG05642.1 hypothetical protein MELLADRAFT_36660 [Melampsora larici-populina 98AG31]
MSGLSKDLILHQNIINQSILKPIYNTLEFYLDFNCPFSAKIFKSINQYLIPILHENQIQTSLIIRQVPQPWHHASTFTHQASLAVSKLLLQSNQSQEELVHKQWKWFTELFEKQTEYFDEPTLNETPIVTKQRLSELVFKTLDLNQQTFLDLVSLNGVGNAGTKVDQTLKSCVRYARQNGVHVTPTVAFNGIIDPSISSSFVKEDWEKFIKEKFN